MILRVNYMYCAGARNPRAQSLGLHNYAIKHGIHAVIFMEHA